jgi:hypothetical protein
MASRAPIDWQQPVTPSWMTPYQAPPPETGFLDNFAAGVGEMQIAGNSNAQSNNLREAYAPVVDALRDATYGDEQTYYGPGGPVHYRQHLLNPANLADDTTLTQYGALPSRAAMRDSIFAEIRRRRDPAQGGDPSFLPGVPDNPDEFERQANLRTRARLQDIRQTQANASGWGWVGGFLGGVAGSFEDPVNLAMLPIGGAETTFLRQVGRAALENMIIEAVSQPQVVQNYAQLGEDQTLGDSIRSVLMAGVMGGSFHAGVRGASEVGGRTIGPVYDRLVNGVFNALPEDMQRRWADRMTLGDHPLVDILRSTVPQENWTPDIHAAVNVVQREHDISSTSPFVPGPAGDAAHGDLLAQRLRQIADGNPPIPEAAPVAPMRPQPISATPTPDDFSNTRNPAFEQVKARIRHVESGGNDSIPNAAGSTALGRFQFTDHTWLSYYRRRYGAGGSDAEVLARKRDGNIQEVLMDDALGDYARMLRRIGAPVDAGNLYMTHGLGVGGAEAFLRANPGERAIDVYRRVDPRHADAAMRQNPFLRGTVADTIAWFHQRMGGHAPPPLHIAEEASPAAPTATDGAPAEEVAAAPSAPIFDDRPVLRPDQFASPEEHALAQVQFEASRDARDGYEYRNTDLLAFPPENTRGQGVFYHGSRGKVPELSEGYYNPNNIYGGQDTFYTTDAADIASGYGRRRESARIYRVEDRGPVNMFDMEEPHPVADIEQLFHVGSDDSGLVPMAIDEAARDGHASLREVMDEIRGASAGEGVTKDEVQEIFDTAITNLREQGFGGMTHTGGLRTNRMPHEARIYFDAPNQISLHDVTPAAIEHRLSAPETAQPEQSLGARYARLSRDRASSLALATSARPSVEALAQFDEPMGKAALAQTQSIEHDLMAAIEKDPSLRERPFVVDAGEGKSLDAILQELDADKAAADAIRGCL